MKTTFSPRIRFNWGFWDGVNAALANRSAEWINHFDKAYEKGYWAGRAAAAENPSSSDGAWQASK